MTANGSLKVYTNDGQQVWYDVDQPNADVAPPTNWTAKKFLTDYTLLNAVRLTSVLLTGWISLSKIRGDLVSNYSGKINNYFIPASASRIH